MTTHARRFLGAGPCGRDAKGGGGVDAQMMARPPLFAHVTHHHEYRHRQKPLVYMALTHQARGIVYPLGSHR